MLAPELVLNAFELIIEFISFVVWSLFDVTDRVKGSTQNVFAQKCFSCAKSASKVIAPPREMLLSFAI